MLSAFTARPIIELRPRDKSKIETILAHGDRVLVGLNTGALRVYRVNESVTTSPENGAAADEPAADAAPPTSPRPTTAVSKPTDLLREIDKFSTRPIEQLAIVKEAGTIVSLSNYHVSMHDLKTYQLIDTLARTRNATSFAITSNIVRDPATGIPEIISRLAVAVKRRLLLWSWRESELAEEVTEVALPEAIRTVAWASATRVMCGMNAGYALVDALTGECSDMAVPGGGALTAVGASFGGSGSGSGGGSGGGGGQTSRLGTMSSAGMGYMGLGGYMPKPLAAKLAEGEMLLARDGITVFVTDEGHLKTSKRQQQIPWLTAAPDAIGYSYPYVLALQGPARGGGGVLEVRNPDTLSLLQTVSLPAASQLHIPAPTYSLAHAGKGFHISSDRCVWKMDATDYDAQVTELVTQRRYDEAISLLGLLEDALLRDKTGSVREVKMLKAETLFAEKKFREAMDLFNEDEVRAPPERVLRLFPPAIAGDLSAWPMCHENGEGDEEQPQPPPPNDQQQQSGGGQNARHEEPPIASRINGNGEKKPRPVDEPAESASPAKTGGGGGIGAGALGAVGAGAGGLAKLFMGRKSHQAAAGQSDAASVASVPKADTDSEDGSGGAKANNNSNSNKTSEDSRRPLDGRDLMEAVLELNSYLAGSRARLQRVIDPTTGKLKPGVHEDPSELTRSGLLPPGRQRRRRRKTEQQQQPDGMEQKEEEEDEEVEETLQATFRLVDTTLFRAYMFARPTLVGSLLRIANFCDPDVVNEKLLEHSRYNELVDFFNGKRLHTQALDLLRRFGDDKAGAKEPKELKKPKEEERATLEALQGPRRTVEYLQRLPPSELDLILRHSEWTLRADPNLGMDVFLADSENAEALPRDRIVTFLAGIDLKLEVRYLEHIISELRDFTPDFHNRLVELYVDWLRGGKDQDRKEWEEVMHRFVRFLRESRQYSLGKAHALIPKEDESFYEAQAVVLSNMGQHKQALAIYVFRMQDYGKAEEYCNRVHMSEDANPTSPIKTRPDSAADPEEAAPSIYHTLLSLYLTPPPPHRPALDPALQLLSRHGSRLPAASTLSLIPDLLPVRELESYFRGRIRAATSTMHETRVVAGLRAAGLIAARAALHLGEGSAGRDGQAGRNRRVVVSEERVCGVCHKRLGGSVVSVMPDNTVVHYGCVGRVGAGTGTGTGIGGGTGIGAGGAEGTRPPSWGRLA